MAFGSLRELTEHLKATADVVFSAVHGARGEDSQLPALLKEAGLPFVASSAQVAAAFDKVEALLCYRKRCTLCSKRIHLWTWCRMFAE
eukprot:scaffold595245_cov33-Prasinocladus_malaysianus.AAC.1